MRKLLFILLFILLLPSLFAAEKYYRQGASGSGTGNNWTDAYTSWATAYGAVNRGDTLWVADTSTSIGSVTLNKAASGSTYLTIRKATAAAHGTETGWNSTYGDGQAVFGDVEIITPYHIFDGATRTETTRMEAPAGYGFRVIALAADSLSGGQNASYSQISYVDAGGTWSESSSPNCSEARFSARFVYNHVGMTFTRCVFHNSGENDGALVTMHGSADLTFDHCDFYMGWGKSTIGAPNVGFTRLTVKYCRFWNASRLDTCPAAHGPGISCEIGAYSLPSTPHENHLVYGNVIYGTAAGGRNASVWFGEPGYPDAPAIGCKVFNNTFVGFPEVSVLGDIYLMGGSGNEARNNLFYNTGDPMKVTANGVSSNYRVASNPFVNYNARDFRLAQAVSGATSLSAPYNTDPDGNTRGSDGTWDVGAYEFGGQQSAPTITSGNATWTNGVAGSYQIEVSGGASTYGAANLPAGLSVNQNNGIISGACSQTVTNSVILYATNSAGWDDATVTFTVLPQVPVLFYWTTDLGFGPILTNTYSEQTFYVSNAGPSGTTLSGAVSNATGDFSIQTSPATFSLSGTQIKTYTMRYSPSAVGATTGTVAINGNGGSNFVALAGSGYPLFASTNWQVTNALILPQMLKGPSYVYTTNAQLAPPVTHNSMVIWSYNQAAQTTGTIWGQFIATNLTSGGSIALHATSTEYVEPASSGETTPHTITSQLTDGFIVVMVGLWDAQDGNITGMAFNGLAMSLMAEHNFDIYGEYRVQIYGRAVGNYAAGTYNVQMTSSATINQYNVGILSFNNVAQTGSYGTSVDAVGPSSTASVTLSSATGELALLAVMKEGATGSPQSGETELFDVGTPVQLWGGSEPGSASVTIGATLSGSGDWVATGVPIRPSTNYGANSLYLTVNTLTNYSTNLLTILPKATNWDSRTLSQVGTGTLTAPQYWTNDAKWVLGTTNVFYLTLKETDTWVRELNYTPDAEAGADVTAPVVTIQNPTNGAVIEVASATLTTLAGVASDNIGITSMTATNNSTGYTVTGTTSWSVDSIPLSAGTNLISVFASDGANTGSDSITVIYTAPAATVPASATDLRVNTLRVTQ